MLDPETQSSLMLRLRDSNDQQAWTQFVSIYEPLILRLMRQRGLQDADARDVTQQVIIAVMRAVDSWKPDGRQASFRRWLFTIARKLALRFVQREKSTSAAGRCGAGGTEMLQLLNNLPEPERETIETFDQEYRDTIFQWAANQVRSEFRDSVWQSFWRTCILNEPIGDVATKLGMNLGYVYVARSRIIARLRDVIEEFEAEHGAE